MSQFRNLVFEGGGIKGIAYGGAVEVLDKKEILPDIVRVAGTSAGAITAALLAVGCTAKDLRSIIEGKDFREFLDSSGFLLNLVRLIRRYGWYKGDAFSEWIGDHVESFAGDRNLTFRELSARARKEPRRFKELYVVASDLSMEQAQIFSNKTSPHMPLWVALRLSMSIPLLFAAARADCEVFVDGGITWNYPINLFDNKRYLYNKKAFLTPAYPRESPDCVYNKETLGFKLGTRDKLADAGTSRERAPRCIDNLYEYSNVLVEILIESFNNMHLHQNDWHRSVFIDSLGIKTIQFDLDKNDVQALIRSGRKGARDYFRWFEDPKEHVINRFNRLPSPLRTQRPVPRSS